jgi:hypothetical protein
MWSWVVCLWSSGCAAGAAGVVVAQQRRRRHLQGAFAVEADGRAHRGPAAAGGVFGVDEELQVRACGSSGTSSVSYIGACGTSCASSRRHHSARSRWRKGRSAPRSCLPGASMRASRVAKRGSSNSVGCSIAVASPCQNLGGLDMCSAIHAVGAGQHVALRHAGPAVRAHDLTFGEQVREGVEVEVRHGLEHRQVHLAPPRRCFARARTARPGCRRRRRSRSWHRPSPGLSRAGWPG